MRWRAKVTPGFAPRLYLDAELRSGNISEIAVDVETSLDASMKDFGYSIVKSLITDIVPDNKVKAAMNDINAAAREREATVSPARTAAARS